MSANQSSVPHDPLDSPSQAKLALTEHPLFRTSVALWFAALFALSMLAVSRSLLERVALWLHFDALVPMSSATRLAMAMMMGGIGGILGLQASKRLAGAKTSEDADEIVSEPVRVRSGTEMLEHFRIRPRDAHPDAPARAPFRVSEDFSLAEPDIEMPRMTVAFDAKVPTASIATPEFFEPIQTGIALTEQAASASEPYAQAAPTAAQRIVESSLEMLSSVELIERLAISMRRRLDQNEVARTSSAAPDTACAPAQADTASMLSGALASLRALG